MTDQTPDQVEHTIDPRQHLLASEDRERFEQPEADGLAGGRHPNRVDDAADLARIVKSYAYRPMGRGSCIIVNEAHGLRKDQIRVLLGAIENAPYPGDPI